MVTRIEAEEKAYEIAGIKQDIISKILIYITLRKEDEATELIVNEIKKNNHFNAIKQDKSSELWYYEDGIRKPNGESHIKEICRQILGLAYTPQRVNKVIAKIEADNFIDADDFFKKEQENVKEILTLNGILNLDTLELKEFTPKKYFFNKINANYNPNATCPNIEKFLGEIVKSIEDIKVIYEFIGYTLLKAYPIQIAFMLIGDGENGKGVLGNLIRTFLNSKNCSSVPLNQLTPENFSCSELFGKLLNWAGDISNTDLKDSGRFKEFTSGTDEINAKRKFQKDLFFINYAKLSFSCNELPRVYDFTHGFWRRWIVLEFPYKFLKKREYDILEDKTNVKLADNELIKKLITEDELSGLLNKALKGLSRLLKNKQFSSTKSTAEIKDFWIRKSDSFTAFCFDNLESSEDNYISKRKIRKEFNKYCKIHKIKGASDKNIKVVLEDLFGVTESQKGVQYEQERVWEGIKFKE